MIKINTKIRKGFVRVEIIKTQGDFLVGLVSGIARKLHPLSQIKSGNPASRAIRMVLERVNVKTLLGSHLAVFAMLSGIVAPNTGIYATSDPEISTLTVEQAPLVTEITIQYPVSQVIINQGYHFFHPGLDIKGKHGDPIKPIMKGKILVVDYSRFAYGNSIVVEHENGLKSLYAHLSKVNISQGDPVDTKTVIGEIGSTGRSTGNHLHLEVYKNGRNINPRLVLGK